MFSYAHTHARARRDQNFGLNELAAIQDVRNEYNLQDITDEPPSSSPTTNDRGKSLICDWYCKNKTHKHKKGKKEDKKKQTKDIKI